jgi:hypothetical protein
MLYNSDHFAVVQIDVPGEQAAGESPARGGFEIVDKFARKGIFIDGVVARSFQDGVRALMESGPTEEAIDDYIAGYTQLAQQPLVLH